MWVSMELENLTHVNIIFMLAQSDLDQTCDLANTMTGDRVNIGDRSAPTKNPKLSFSHNHSIYNNPIYGWYPILENTCCLADV